MMYDPMLLSALKNADNFMLCAHKNPDGDTVGSMLSAGRLLRKMGKKVTMVCADKLPGQLSWLPDAEKILPVEAVCGQKFDAALAVDISDEKLMGAAFEYYQKVPLRFSIDHHPGSAPFAHYSLVDSTAAAAGELIVALWEELEMPLDREAATQLYAAISTDTGNFRFNNVTDRTFACMEKLMRAGLDLSEPARRLFLTQSRAAVAAQARALASLRFFAGGRATCMHLTREDKAACGAENGDLHGLVNQGLYIEGVEMTFMADENEDGWKISLRALPGYDVSAIAQQFGGGGHRLAAGCVLRGSYDEIEGQLRAAAEEALRA